MTRKDGGHFPRTYKVKMWVQEKRRLFPSDLLRDEQGLETAFVEDFGDFTLVYDGYWTRFRSRSYNWDERCRFEEAMQMLSLPECARHSPGRVSNKPKGQNSKDADQVPGQENITESLSEPQDRYKYFEGVG